MTDPSGWLAHTFGWGSAAALVTGAVLVIVEMLAPYAFLGDHPADIREHAAPATRRQRVAGAVGGSVFLLTLLGTLAAVTVGWGMAHPEAGFLELALTALVALLLFAAVDLVIVDWLVICTWRPRAIVFPGTEDCEGWRDYGHHAREQLRPRALAVLVSVSVLIGALAWWLT